ncbi:AlpA family phage regulatory protein [Dyella caseinilytica]|uniref:AlpA family phage regulatory protein n=2 Tax=Dyella caseinilytica TaxID=1849581 RepID=A0ABX7H219_9GAMM|nr:AlpA family phage regulatory protein [Dyella caseinilytica]
MVAARAGLGRTTIYAGIAAKTFPGPVKVGKRSLWVESEVDRWIAARIAERDMGSNVGSRNAA